MVNTVNAVNTGGFETLTTSSNNRANRSDGKNFDSFLAPRENMERQAERPARNDGGQRENRSPARNIETTMRSVTHEQPAQSVTDSDMTTTTAEYGADKVDMDVRVLENVDIALTSLEDEVLAEIAAALGITPQALAEILNALGMAPVDLLDSYAQTELLQVLHGVDDEVSLLNLPATLPIMQEISKTIEKHAPTLLEYQAQVQPQSQPQYAAVLDEVALADLETQPDAEFVPTAQILHDDVPQTDLPADYEASETVAMTENTAATTTTTNAEPQQSVLEPIVAFAQAIEQPVDFVVKPTTVAAPPQAPISPQNVMEQIVNHMRFEVRGDIAEIRIQLKPEHLGEVSLRIAAQNGIVVAQFVAESQRVKEIIESNFSQLRDSLEQQGINISEIEVSVAQDDADRQFAFEANITGDRIQQLMEEGLEEELQAENLEENLVDYLA